jgi:hypothetical protein
MAKTHAWPGGHRGLLGVSKWVAGVFVSQQAQGDMGLSNYIDYCGGGGHTWLRLANVFF